MDNHLPNILKIGYNTYMRNIIQFNIDEDKSGHFVASAIGHFIVTQGDTFDELIKNIQEATELYLQDENLEELGLSSTPSLLANFEISHKSYAR